MATSHTPELHTVRRRGLRAMRWYSWLLLVGVVTYGIAIAMHWDDRGLLWVLERFETPAERQESVWLPDYRAVIDAKALPGMEKDEASDLSYNPQTKTLFSVMGKNPFLAELTLQGDVLRKIPLVGWSNPEGVAVMENGLLGIVDERNHLLTIVKVDATTRELNVADFPQYDLGPSKDQNKAFEAIAWDPRKQQLLLGEERPPALFTWSSDGSQVLKGDKRKLDSDELDLRNLSALGIDPRTGHTLVLSADSHMLLELDETGEQVSFMTLLGGFNGLKKTIPRAEGVAMDDQGVLYIVSEPNLFYRFERDSDVSAQKKP
ncbi:SdiA-regulated domain-containing protein [Pseudomonas chlororaphis]|uniref:DNA-binding protein n=1 Tax=Pseudomonas chlororaphis TaxID=587753 RepID=A0A1Q8EGF1_9PSED|nr:SdiA-regulated domain-containing protein [Pseudomonas chlororaphis]OLF50872.1 DNA-binding protein [Pseudomonas chlororaphis]